MDNPNPIYYKDLVTPDSSITDLIAQLDKLIEKYDEAQKKFKASAEEQIKSVKDLSGATEEQRKQITLMSEASDKLAHAYEETTNEERQVLRRRYEIIQAAKEEKQIDNLLVQINNSVEGSYNRLSAQYRLNKIRLNEMSAEQRRSTEFGRKLETETRKIYEEMSRLQKATGKYTLEVGHYENALRGLPGPISQVVSGVNNMRGQIGAIAQSDLPFASKAVQGFTTVLSGTIGLIMIFVRQLTGSAKLLREFEQANANLSTIMGGTKEEMQLMEDTALRLGRTTKYTASQVTALQIELAKLGFGPGSIVAMQEGVLNFATAVGTDLASAASVAGSTLRAFNIASADTEKSLAVMAVATNKSALSFDRIQTSIGTVFPVAKAFGLSLEDTVALLGALANAGFDASSAATATRNIILKLADANGKLAKAMGGPAKSFDEIIDGLVRLRKSGTDLNEALELTDKRSVAAFAALLSGAEQTKELRQELEGVDEELRRIAEERANTVQGATDKLKSAWQDLTLAFQDSNGAIKDTIEWLTRLVVKMRQVIFPDDTFVSDSADRFTKQLQDYYAENGEEAARSYVERFVAFWEGKAAETSKAAEKDAPINKWLGIGNTQVAAQSARNSAEAARRAALAVMSQIDNDAMERQQRAAREAEQAEQERNRRQEELTNEQKKAIEAAKKQRIADRRAVVEAINLEMAVTEAGTEKMLKLRLDKVEAERQLELETNRQKVESERQDEAAINAKYDKKKIDEQKAFNAEVAKLNVQRLQAEQQAIQLQIAITEDGTQEMLALRLENVEKQRQIEIEQNKQKDEKIRQDEAAINAKYDKMALRESANFNTKLAQRDLKAAQDRAEAEFDLLDRNERQKTLFRLQQEKARLEGLLKINETAVEKMTEDEIAAIKATIKGIEKETGRLGYNNLWELLGLNLDSDQQSAMETAIDSVKDSIGSLIDSWNEVADAAVRAAEAQVSSANDALKAQIDARNAGYANEVETAQKELDLARKNQEKALKEQQRAQRAQQALDTLEQTSSLITASANLWKAFSGGGAIGMAAAIAAIAIMFGSFTAAKIKAAQVSRMNTEQYGEGTVELLEGGSHASGHDIDLGMKKDGTRRRAEGGEYFAVINKRSSRRYRNTIPEVINALNDGSFADKYQKANAAMSGVAIGMLGGRTDISKIEDDVNAIRRQGDESRFVDGNGDTVIRYKNLTRKIKS